VFEPAAVAHDRIFEQKGKEFARKVRTLTGNYQLLRLDPWLLTARNPILFRLISHKLLRLLVPVLLLMMFVASGLASGTFYKTVFFLQVLFYCLAGAGRLIPPSKQWRVVSIANTFVMLNIAAAVAFYNFVTRRENVWV
jgi:poly-beta-1,6-N-acetyl-D-glucosamine synthase